MFAVIAERRVTPGSHTVELRTVGAAARDHGVRAVGRRTPTRVRYGDEHTSQHEFFVFLNESRPVLLLFLKIYYGFTRVSGCCSGLLVSRGFLGGEIEFGIGRGR